MLKAPKLKQRKRLGRGSGSGTGKTSGKGHKGQNARSGGGVRPGFEGGQMPLFRRVARRGFSNYPFRTEYEEVSLRDLDRVFAAGETVSIESLQEKGVIRARSTIAKILANGELTKALNVALGVEVSAGARAKIEAAGGSVSAPPRAESETAPIVSDQSESVDTASEAAASGSDDAPSTADATSNDGTQA
ncbi:MAG: 50S ribosomal protein L15 [Spirochaetaceae bacterium]|nr:MAG: 50S ribosomal protein L15 [Spirochaetaceae bacterium]